MTYVCAIAGCGNVEEWSIEDQCDEGFPGLCDWCHTYAHVFDAEYKTLQAKYLLKHPNAKPLMMKALDELKAGKQTVRIVA